MNAEQLQNSELGKWKRHCNLHCCFSLYIM